jgi:DNA-binding NarL/FixJ family response regulator
MDQQSVMYRILLVDDIASVREALRWVLESEPGLVVVGEASDGMAALVEAHRLQPDVVILDLMLPALDGIAVARRIKMMPVPPLVVVLSVHGGAAARRRAKAVGADGFVEKSGGWIPLLDLLRTLPSLHRH